MSLLSCLFDRQLKGLQSTKVTCSQFMPLLFSKKARFLAPNYTSLLSLITCVKFIPNSLTLGMFHLYSIVSDSLLRC
jgi:hypothetical protein